MLNPASIRTVAPGEFMGIVSPPCLADRDIRDVVAQDNAAFGETRFAVKLLAYVGGPDEHEANRLATRVNQTIDGVAHSLRRAGIPVFTLRVESYSSESIECTITADVTAATRLSRTSAFEKAFRQALKRLSVAVAANDPDAYDMQPNEDYR